ncbi:hypothetical protein COB72_07270 [bacterium]|nr:MAG: hypothetical protein COB72_07270 [bacterium]
MIVGSILTCSLCACETKAEPNDEIIVVESADADDQPIDTTLNPPAPSSGLSGSFIEVFAQIKEQDPIRRAGMRANLLRQIQMIVPVVVVVSDAPSYLAAISKWEGMVRFPILWDDGTSQAHEDIARFVRSFDPEHVVMYSGAGESSWVGSREQKEAIFESVLAKAMNDSAVDWHDAISALDVQGIVSPGIVVTDVLDRAWPAALALSAGRMQPIGFVNKPSAKPYQTVTTTDADSLERAIERVASRTGKTWNTIGDDIDAITLVMNTGTMIKTGNGSRDRLALSDRIGRRESNGAGAQWAWCGQIIGTESRAVYQAMCALFLTIDQAFIFDGYSDQPPWSSFDGTQAGEALRSVGFEVELHDQPKNRITDWKSRMVRPIGDADRSPGSAGLFLMNSKGTSDQFDLPGTTDGNAKPGHMPILNVPMAMHIVHSFSLQRPFARNTVGGRLIERGVFVYAGSVDEPFLHAFVPTPTIARRLGGSLAFAAAVHYDKKAVWKIAVLGDPLVTVGPSGRRIDAEFVVPGSIDLDDRSKQRLKAGDYLGAIEDLSFLGRDDAIARIALALMKDRPEEFNSKVALASLPSLFRSGEYDKLLDAYERLDAVGQVDHLMQDLLWLSSPYLLARASGETSERARIEAILRANIRSGQSVQDAEVLAMYMRKRSIDQAVGVLEALRPTLKPYLLKQLDRAIARVRK